MGEIAYFSAGGVVLGRFPGNFSPRRQFGTRFPPLRVVAPSRNPARGGGNARRFLVGCYSGGALRARPAFRRNFRATTGGSRANVGKCEKSPPRDFVPTLLILRAAPLAPVEIAPFAGGGRALGGPATGLIKHWGPDRRVTEFDCRRAPADRLAFPTNSEIALCRAETAGRFARAPRKVPAPSAMRKSSRRNPVTRARRRRFRG